MSEQTTTAEPTVGNGHATSEMPKAKPLVFEEHQRAVPVVIRDDSGAEKSYEVREMSGNDLSAWMAFVTKRMAAKKKGSLARTSDQFKDLHATLISMCLFDKAGRVPKAKVARWGSKTLNGLYAECQKINGLVESEEEEEEKNSEPADQSTSGEG